MMFVPTMQNTKPNISILAPAKFLNVFTQILV